MEILYPIWLASLISIPIVLVFLLISKKHRRIQVPSLLIWRRVLENKEISLNKSKKIDLLAVAILLILLFVCLALAKVAFVSETSPKITLNFFIDDSALMNFKPTNGENCIEFVENRIQDIVKDVENVEINAFFPISSTKLNKLDSDSLIKHLRSMKFTGMQSSDEYRTDLRSFLQSSNDLKVVFSPVNIADDIKNFDNVEIINVNFDEQPAYVEFLDFEDQMIFLRLNRKALSFKSFAKDDSNYTSNSIIDKTATLLNVAPSGCFTVNGLINKYFAKTDNFNIGVVGFDEEFCEFASKILRNVTFTKESTFTEKTEFDAWLIADEVSIPDFFDKPIIYLNQANDKNWVTFYNPVNSADALTIADSNFLQGVSVNELKFEGAKTIKLELADWSTKLIETPSTILAGIITKHKIERGVLNTSNISKDDVSAFTLILNIFEYLSSENLIERADYHSMTPSRFMKMLNSKGFDKQDTKFEIHQLFERKWQTTFQTGLTVQFKSKLAEMLTAGALITVDGVDYAVSPDFEDLKFQTTENSSWEKQIDEIRAQFQSKKSIEYTNTDLILLGLAVLLLFAVLYVKRSTN